jgi:hypothetical protein
MSTFRCWSYKPVTDLESKSIRGGIRYKMQGKTEIGGDGEYLREMSKCNRYKIFHCSLVRETYMIYVICTYHPPHSLSVETHILFVQLSLPFTSLATECLYTENNLIQDTSLFLE